MLEFFRMKNLTILISGGGSNFRAIHEACKSKKIKRSRVTMVISNSKNEDIHKYIEDEGIQLCRMSPSDFPNRDLYDQTLLAMMELSKPDLICLAGYMKILPKFIVDAFPNKIINIHPSVLPRHKGLNTHQRVIDSGDEFHGCTVHYVTPELDDGPHLCKGMIRVNRGTDTAESLEKRVKDIEHGIFINAIQKFFSK